jgi:hypothetical protein
MGSTQSMQPVIRVWQSFSCNNSSSYRLVARFGDAKTAKEAEGELATFFKEHAQETDKTMEENDYDFDDKPGETAKALAKRYGFEWKRGLHWGDEGLQGDEPSVIAQGDVLAIYHSYCGGFGNDLPKYFVSRGAEVEKEDSDEPTISVLFKLPNDVRASAIKRQLSSLFRQADTEYYVHDWKKHFPWIRRGRRGAGSADEIAFFCDGKSIGFFIPIDPKDVERLTDYLRTKEINNPIIRLCAYADKDKFRVAGIAKCDACGHAPLEYLLDGTSRESEQLGCEKCGGMYDLKTVVAAKLKDEKKQAKIEAKAAAAVAEAEAVAEKAKAKKKTSKAKPKAKAKAKAKKKAR